jgi:hypothetical protein
VLRASGTDAGAEKDDDEDEVESLMKERRMLMKADAVWMGEGENREQSSR